MWGLLKDLLTKFVPHKGKPRIIAPGEVFIPQDAMLDLWQSVRTYGFCVARMMPAGLDLLAPYIMPLMAQLEYMNPVKLSTSRQVPGVTETALQLFPTPGGQPSSSLQPTYAVQPV
jgi:hypothetical protein